MASFKARIFGAFLRVTRTVSKNFQGGPAMLKIIEGSRQLPIPTPTEKQRARIEVREESFSGRAVWQLSPKGGAAPKGHLLYWHGGGYVFTISPFHWNMLVNLVEKHGIAVTVPLYPLAPEAGVLDTTGFALDFYRHYCDQVPGPFVMGGDSAGGGLTAATVMAAREAGLRLPSGLMLICPWLNAEGNDPSQIAIEKRDCILRLSGIRDAGKLYARDLPVTDPKVSPIHGDWQGLPPMQMFGGGDDILVADARALKAKRPDIAYDERAGLMHVWPIFNFAEAYEAQAAMGRFIADAR